MAEWGICKKCNKKRFIVNKKYFYCEECNWERLHPNKKKWEVQKNSFSKSSFSPIRNFSKKRQKTENNYHKVIKEILEKRGAFCESCGNSEFLSFSHLIPRSRRADLIDNKENIRIHCMVGKDGKKGCHEIWESGSLEEKSKMKDWDKNVSILRKLDGEYLDLILNEE